MTIDRKDVVSCISEAKDHLENELLPFWLDRCRDVEHGGFLTHFDRDGNLQEDKVEKSLIAQTRTIYTMASAHRAGWRWRPGVRHRKGVLAECGDAHRDAGCVHALRT